MTSLMAILKILAAGDSEKSIANARGKLFETLMADVMRCYGYTIDNKPNVNYAGMEIDIEGTHTLSGVPLYAECKCYDSSVSSPHFQAFFGKYMTRWLKNNHSHGLFIVLPNLSSPAKGFYKENCSNSSIVCKILEETEVINAIYQTGSVVTPDIVSRLITKDLGIPGDYFLLYTDKGYFWIQFIVPPGSGISRQFAVFDAQANVISDKSTIDYLRSLWPDLKDFIPCAIALSTGISQTVGAEQAIEDIVEVKGSSSCFEYQFPAAPEHFVGRQGFLEEVDRFAEDVINERTSSRAILFEGYSGWGKSSLVLSSVARLKRAGHIATAIDCRSATSARFPLLIVKHVCQTIPEIKTQVFGEQDLPNVTGFEGAVNTILQISQGLKPAKMVLAIFLDQFENIFSLPDVLKQIATFVLRLCDAKSNVILGFSWKSDLVGSTSDFPYALRDTIKDSSCVLSLTTFSQPETSQLLDKLSEELRTPLRKDLRFFLSEFSQGYPWLLKKLCAHVKSQREDGLAQIDIASTLLNVKGLFDEDLGGLSPQEEETLHRIAQIAPITISEVSEAFDPQVVQNLVNRRLLVRIGPKYDVYWDIFRDYLNTGRLPIQENYILRAQLGPVIEATKLIAKNTGPVSLKTLQQDLDLAPTTVLNTVRDMKLLGLASSKGEKLTSQAILPTSNSDFDLAIRNHMHDWLPRNRLVSRLLKRLNEAESFHLDGVADILKTSCPYISASEKTWITYARIICSWLDLADLAIFDSFDTVLTRYLHTEQVRERRYFRRRQRAGMPFPLIQYGPIEKSLERIMDALRQIHPIDWSGLSPTSISKSICALEQLGFIRRKGSTMSVTQKAVEFVTDCTLRPKLFAEGALTMKSFATFIDMLEAHKEKGLTLVELAQQVRHELNMGCTDSTAKIYVKIMLDWARHAQLAPGVFAKTRKGPFRTRKKRRDPTRPLFEDN